MTKQEIQKAIDNGESVWINGMEHKLDKYYFVAEYNNESTLYLMTCGYEEDDWNNYPVEAITNIYKTKAEAEHYLYHANVTRKETLPFVTWEEFKNGKSVNFVCRYGLEYILKKKYGSILLIWVNANNCITSWDLTEENFYKAYDECVRLFERE